MMELEQDLLLKYFLERRQVEPKLFLPMVFTIFRIAPQGAPNYSCCLILSWRQQLEHKGENPKQINIAKYVSDFLMYGTTRLKTGL